MAAACRRRVGSNGAAIATYANGTVYFNRANWLGTIRQRATMTGGPYEACTSLPYGDGLACSGPDPSPLHFAGQPRDSETGLDAFPSRSYNARVAGWTTPDPTGLAAVNPMNPQSWNPYGYVNDNPMSAIDPLGLNGNGSTGRGAGQPAEGPCPPFIGTVAVVNVYEPWEASCDAGCIASVLSQITGSLQSDVNNFLAGLTGHNYSPGSSGSGGDGAASSISTAPIVGPGCSEALAAAGRGSSLAGVNRADANWAVLAAQSHGIPTQVLAAIGVYESGFLDRGQIGKGIGIGVSQNDSPPNPAVPFTARLRADLPGQASAAAALLQGADRSLLRQGFNPGLALLGAIRDYNGGGWNLTPTLLEAGPQYLDLGTTGGDYVTNVVEIAASCF